MQIQKFSKATYQVNKDKGYFPKFQLVLRERLNLKKAINVAIVGEAGIGKSYVAWTLAMLLDPKFTVNQIVYTYQEYMALLQKLGIGRPIVFDEPSYAMSKRDWYLQLNKVLVKTLESQRFKVHPLFIPIINLNLLDKTIRDHLIQFLVHVVRRTPQTEKQRGYVYANVYRLYASQWEEKTYHVYICSLKYPMIDNCKKDSCIGCQKLSRCKEFRAIYERKKATIQEERYEQAEQEAAKIESAELTDSQLEKMIYQELKDKVLDENGEIDARLLRVVLLREKRVKIGYNRAYTIKKLLEYDYPNEFSNTSKL